VQVEQGLRPPEAPALVTTGRPDKGRRIVPYTSPLESSRSRRTAVTSSCSRTAIAVSPRRETVRPSSLAPSRQRRTPPASIPAAEARPRPPLSRAQRAARTSPFPKMPRRPPQRSFPDRRRTVADKAAGARVSTARLPVAPARKPASGGSPRPTRKTNRSALHPLEGRRPGRRPRTPCAAAAAGPGAGPGRPTRTAAPRGSGSKPAARCGPGARSGLRRSRCAAHRTNAAARFRPRPLRFRRRSSLCRRGPPASGSAHRSIWEAPTRSRRNRSRPISVSAAGTRE